jgi:hypothetical protein
VNGHGGSFTLGGVSKGIAQMAGVETTSMEEGCGIRMGGTRGSWIEIEVNDDGGVMLPSGMEIKVISIPRVDIGGTNIRRRYRREQWRRDQRGFSMSKSERTTAGEGS